MNNINFTFFPELSAGSYKLRELREADKNEIFILRSDEKILRYLDIKKAESTDDALDFIKMIREGIYSGASFYWAISVPENDRLIGTICFWNFSEDKLKAEIGFALLPEFHGRGVMQTVIPVVLTYGFEKLGLKIIEGEAAPGNIKSIRLMEKFGFTPFLERENTLVYSLSKSGFLLQS